MLGFGPRLTSADSPSTTSATSTSADCASSGTVYGGGSLDWCRSAADTQSGAQGSTVDLSEQAKASSSAAGDAAIRDGTFMILVGVGLMQNPNTQGEGVALVLLGQARVASGQQALQAADQMGSHSTTADTQDGNLGSQGSSVSPPSSQATSTVAQTSSSPSSSESQPGSGPAPGVSTDVGDAVRIDDALLRTGIVDQALNDAAKKTGIGKEALTDALKNGNALDLAAEKAGMSQSQLDSAVYDAGLNPLSDAEARAKAGLPEQGAGTDSLSGGVVYSMSAGAAGGRRSSGERDLASLLAPAVTAEKGGSGPPFGSAGGGSAKISPEIQAAFDKAGITNLSIFQIVHRQYRKRTPMVLGTQAPQSVLPQKNPFADLSSDPSDLSL